MYWIQEYDCKKMSRRFYHCDNTADIAKLPTNTTAGDKDAAVNEEALSLAHYGDRCFCIEDASTYELRNEQNDWKKIS